MAKRLRLFSFCFFLLLLQTTGAQQQQVFKEKGYTLTFTNQDATLDTALQQRMVKTFFEVYPVLAKNYNKKTLKEVTFLIDTAYTGVAETGDGHVRFSNRWFHKNPKDIDVVTHEVMHIVQAYPDGAGPWWVTEGIADYVRYTFGVDNAGGGWALPSYKAGQSYENGYRVTARFLAWIETKVKKGFVQKLDAAMRSKKYTADFWKQQTGKTVDELWKAYSENPTL